MEEEEDYFADTMQDIEQLFFQGFRLPPRVLLPDEATLEKAKSTLIDKLPEEGHGTLDTRSHLLVQVAKGFNGSSLQPCYYGFVTGGVTPAAMVGDIVASVYDQNVAVHLPEESIATTVEDIALKMLLDLFHLDRDQWSGQFTTGATSSNIVGLTLGREFVVNRAVKKATGRKSESNTVGASGLIRACRLAGIDDVLVATTRPHSSLGKAASIAGMGRNSVIDVGGGNHGLSFDLQKLEGLMIERCKNSAFIVAVSCSEVNTGLFATDGQEAMQDLRTLCDRYGAWLHVDGGETNSFFSLSFLAVPQR